MIKNVNRRVQISATVPADVLEQVDAKLHAQQTSRSGLITDLFTDWLTHESN